MNLAIIKTAEDLATSLAKGFSSADSREQAERALLVDIVEALQRHDSDRLLTLNEALITLVANFRKAELSERFDWFDALRQLTVIGLASVGTSRPNEHAELLANRVKRAIIGSLGTRSIAIQSEIAEDIGTTESAVSKALADLERDGYVHREKIGRKNLTSLAPEGQRALVRLGAIGRLPVTGGEDPEGAPEQDQVLHREAFKMELTERHMKIVRDLALPLGIDLDSAAELQKFVRVCVSILGAVGGIPRVQEDADEQVMES